jgi:hypothetical protein
MDAGRQLSIVTRLHLDGGDLAVRLLWRWALAARRRTATT